MRRQLGHTSRTLLLLLLLSCLLAGVSATNLRDFTRKVRDFTGLQHEAADLRSYVDVKTPSGPGRVPHREKLPVSIHVFTCGMQQIRRSSYAFLVLIATLLIVKGSSTYTAWAAVCLGLDQQVTCDQFFTVS